MPVSAGIYNALNQPVRSVADYAADYDQADARKQALQRNALMLQESQANMADRQRARMEGETIRNRLQALGEGATPEARINALEATGLPQGFSQADALRKTLIEQRKGNASAAKDEAATEADKYKLVRTKLEHGVQWLQVAQSPQQAQQMYADGVQKGYWSMQDAQQQAQTIPQDPEQFAQWKQTQLAQILDAAKLLPNVQTRNTGGSTDTLAVNPLTGAPTVTGSVRNTQTPDSVASNARMAADAAAARAVQVRGQNLTDARARDANTNAAATGKAPPGYRFTPEGNLEAIPGGPADRKNTDAGIREQRSKEAAVAQADRVIAKVDAALDKVGVLTAGPGSMLAGLPGTDARNLQSTLETIKANLGFAELQAMRDASPTGGALGAIAVQELIALQSTVASLDQGQSPAQLKKSLGDINRHYSNWKKAVAGGDPAAPTGGAPAVGDVVDGYRFKGGNPADKANWERQ